MLARRKSTQGKVDSRVLVAISVIALLGAGIYAWATFSHYGGLPPKSSPDRPSPGRPGRGPGGPMGDLNLTADQQKKLEAMRTQDRPTTPGGFEQRREQFEKILTPEQREQMQQRMQNRMERMRKVLSDQDMEALERRREEMRRRGPPPGGRRPGGNQQQGPQGGGQEPPPGGPPPD